MNDPYRTSAPPPAPAARRRCLYCAAELDAGGFCFRCQMPGTNGGARAGAGAGALACPRCGADRRLAAHALRSEGGDDVGVLECHGCRGTFVDARAWTGLFDAVARGDSLELGRFVPLPPNASKQLVSLVACPICRGEMDRAHFAARSGVVIDVCNDHGVWLDAAELVSVVAYFRRRPAAAARDSEEEDAQAEHEHDQETRALEARVERLETLYDATYRGGVPSEEADQALSWIAEIGRLKTELAKRRLKGR